MNLDKGKLYIEILALKRIYNFVVKILFNWNELGPQNIIGSLWILKLLNNLECWYVIYDISIVQKFIKVV